MKHYDELQKRNFWGSVNKAPGFLRSKYINKLLKESGSNNISAIMGVRRSGKSTIMLQLIDKLIAKKEVKPHNTLFINFEDPRLSDLLINNNLLELLTEFYEAADNRSTVYFFLDEIQNVQNWEQIIRTTQDTLAKCKIYITGSSANLLGKELGTKLAGRYLSTEVFPLNYDEYTRFKKTSSLQNFMKFGGFPNVVLTKENSTKTQLLQDYFDSILLKDLSTRYNIRNDFKLKRLVQFLFTNTSNQASSYKLSKDIGLSPESVLQYFKYIEDAYLGFFIPKYSKSLRTQEYNPKKFYTIDTGLQNAVSFKIMDNVGKLFENLVFLELRRLFSDIYYWEEEEEVDFIIKKGESISLICNASYSIEDQSTREREIESLKAAMHFFNTSKSVLIIANGNTEKMETEAGIIEVVEYSNLKDYIRKL